MYIILSIILLLIFFGFLSMKHQRKIDDFNANMYSKKQHEYFSVKSKPKMKIDYKGKLIDMDEHFLDLTNEKN